MILLTDLVVDGLDLDCHSVDWSVHMPLMLHIIFLGLGTVTLTFDSISISSFCFHSNTAGIKSIAGVVGNSIQTDAIFS